jgi:hypothetical protein
VWRTVQAISRRQFESAASESRPPPGAPSGLGPEELDQAFSAYFEEYGELRTDPAARSPRYLEIEKGETAWKLRQLLVDPEEDLGWALCFEFDLVATRETGAVALRIVEVQSG